MSGQGQAVRDITSLMQVSEDYVRDVIHAFNERGFAALDPKWSGGRRAGTVLRTRPRAWRHRCARGRTRLRRGSRSPGPRRRCRSPGRGRAGRARSRRAGRRPGSPVRPASRPERSSWS
nr:helix-turn-helix domain-containing protein [Saccharothrix carnea]